MKTKLEQLKQLEVAYSEMQMVRDTDPATQSRPVPPVAEGGTQSQSPRSRSNEGMAAAVAERVDGAEDESSTAASPAPPPRQRPPKNYRYI